MAEISTLIEEISTEVNQEEITKAAKKLNGKTLLEIAKIYATKEKEANYWKETAYLDPLTNVLNKRGMEETFERVKNVFGRKEKFTGYTLIFIDAVGLKAINENESYLEGDGLLKEIAGTAKNSIGNRGNEFVARIGGDEFVRIAINETEEQLNFALNRFLSTLPTGIQINIGTGFWNPEIKLKEALDEASSAATIAKSLGEKDKKTDRSKEGHIVYTVGS